MYIGITFTNWSSILWKKKKSIYLTLTETYLSIKNMSVNNDKSLFFTKKLLSKNAKGLRAN